MTSTNNHATSQVESALRSRVARFVQLVIGVPTAIFGIVLLILGAVLHHGYAIPSIALAELGAVLLSLSIMDIYYVWARRINSIYLADAAVEIVLVIFWLMLLPQARRSQGW